MSKAPWTRMKGGMKPRSKPAKPKRKSVRQRSHKMVLRMAAYRVIKASILKYRGCCACFALGLDGSQHKATELHHSRGRVGSLLTDLEYIYPVCRRAHNYIHSHPEKARKVGLLCQKGDWNKP